MPRLVRLLTLGALGALGALLAAPASAQLVSDLDADGRPVAAEAAPDSAPVEGIKVHGDWTLTIREPNGDVVDVVEFSNRLVPSGDAILIGMLSGVIDISGMLISLGLENPETGTDFAALRGVTTINYDTDAFGEDTDVLVLNSSIQVDTGLFDSDNIIVGSVVVVLEGSGGFFGQSGRAFTSKNLVDGGILVTRGQTVDAEVRLSFD